MKKLTSSIYSFEQLIENGFLYVDKTEFIWRLVESAPAMYFMLRFRILRSVRRSTRTC